MVSRSMERMIELRARLGRLLQGGDLEFVLVSLVMPVQFVLFRV